jgi:putative ABC transport system permease protein
VRNRRPALFNQENITFAMANIAAHKFRSFLTVLGIIAGIVTVILVASILVGVRQGVVDLFREFGPDNVFAFHLQGDPYNPRARPEELTRRPLRLEYAGRLVAACPSLRDVAAQVLVPNVISGRAVTARHRNYENENILVQGASWNFAEVTNGELQAGRSYSYDEESRRAKVCLLGANIADALFPAEDPIGKEIVVDGSLYSVLGIFEKRKGSFFGENRQDNVVMIPAATIRSRYPAFENVVLYCQAFPGRREAALGEIEEAMRRLRGIRPGQASDFNLSTADLIVEQFDRVTSIIRTVTIAISGLGLLVGGIGVMNIMLMSVTQRTREIGVRKAVGARRRDIIWQFLLEAALLTGMGGATGVTIATVLWLIISYLVPPVPATPPLWAVLTGLGTSVVVGLVFGVWPAFKAARLDPVESLRYE